MDQTIFDHHTHAEKTIRASIWNHPNLFGDPDGWIFPMIPKEISQLELIETKPAMGRQMVLYHLFLVPGNGYKWANGQIVNTDGVTLKEPDAGIEKELSANKKEILADMPEIIRNMVEKSYLESMTKSNDIITTVRKDIEYYATYDIGTLPGLMDISDTLLTQIPDDATADWLDLCGETCELILNCPTALPIPGIDLEKTVSSCHKIAIEALEHISIIKSAV